MSYFNIDKTNRPSIDWRFSPWDIPIKAAVFALFIAYSFWRIGVMLKKLSPEAWGAILFLAVYVPFAIIGWHFRYSVGQ